MERQEFCIYWANAMFSQADRNFNSECVRQLRDAGYNVFLPQETKVNHLLSPTAADIFRIDTCAVLESELLIACIDQEAIDCGVASEIGIAFACGIPVIGLYTDIRQHRQGESRMYKNPYVIGAIQANGEIVLTIEDLLLTLQKYSDTHVHNPHDHLSENSISQHLDVFAPDYTNFVNTLEGWYDPPWNIKTPLAQALASIIPSQVLDFGCGPGDTGSYILDVFPDTFYVGYDQSDVMVQLASTTEQRNTNCVFTSHWSNVIEYAKEKPFDMALLLFVLHDSNNPLQTIGLIAQCLRPDGIILIVDLSILDLPQLTKFLRTKLARPFWLTDKRIDPGKLRRLAHNANLSIIDCGLALPQINFPSPDAIDQYLEKFGIYSGMDLPLGLSKADFDTTRELIQMALESQSYPFSDQRAFITCTLKKGKIK